MQCILGPSQEVREYCPEAAVWAKQTGALGSRAGGIHRGYGLFSPDQPSGDGGGGGGQHEGAGPPGLHAGVVGPEVHRVRQGFCLTRSGCLLSLAEKGI